MKFEDVRVGDVFEDNGVFFKGERYIVTKIHPEMECFSIIWQDGHAAEFTSLDNLLADHFVSRNKRVTVTVSND